MPAADLQDPLPSRPVASVVVPAHDEESVIGRCLGPLADAASSGALEVVVVANGCHDRTADEARRACPAATVVELAEAGKINALNEGDRRATAWPRIYLDADIEVSADTLVDLARELTAGGAAAAAPSVRFDLEGCSAPVRAFYRVWQRLPYLNEGMIGSGLYALSAEGRARFGTFPALTADDQFVQQLFSRAERRTLPGRYFTVHPPRRLAGLLAVRRRVYRGNRELVGAAGSGAAGSGAGRSGGEASGAAGGRVGALGRLVRSEPRLLPAVVVYAAVNAVADVAGRRSGPGTWERDDTARRSVSSRGHGRIGYLISRYPAVSHTFVLQEVRAVRRAGVAVDTFSMQAADPADLLSEVDHEEAATTWAVRPIGAPALLAAHAAVLVRSPSAWLATLRSAVSGAPPGLRNRVWGALYFAQAVVLHRELRRRGITHLHAHLANVAADVAMLRTELGRRCGDATTWSFTMHGPTELFDVGRYRLGRKVQSASLVVCISDFARSQLMAVSEPASWAKLRVVHMGADLHRYRPADRPAADPGAAGPLRLLTVGRLDPVKGQAILVDAIAEARAGGHDWELTIIGEGAARPSLEAQVARLGLRDVVTLRGAVGQDELPAEYATHDVFCMASFAEGVPVVLMEAMASGLPTVATAIAGIPELITDGRSGLLVPPGRPDALVAAVSTLEDPAERRRLGQAGAVAVAAGFDAERCGLEVAELLAPLATSSGAKGQ